MYVYMNTYIHTYIYIYICISIKIYKYIYTWYIYPYIYIYYNWHPYCCLFKNHLKAVRIAHAHVVPHSVLTWVQKLRRF